MGTAPRPTLARSERVRRRPDFERAYETGTKSHGRFMTLFVVANGTARPRFGVAATRKIGSAVVRNRAKRLAREIFRRHKLQAGVDVVVVPRREMIDASFASLEADYLAILERRHRERPRSSPRGGRGGRARPAARV